MNEDKYIIEYGSDYRNLSLRENKGYLIYEVGILGGDDKVNKTCFVLFVHNHLYYFLGSEEDEKNIYFTCRYLYSC